MPCCGEALSGHKPARLPGLPPFTAGAVGFFAYDAVRQIERLPELAKDELGVPDACLLFFDEVLAFDHVRKEIWLVVTADVTRGKTAEDPAAAYDKAVERLDKLEKRLSQPLPKLPGTPGQGQAQGEAPDPQEGFSGRRGAHQGVHRRGRYLPGRAVAALRRGAGDGQLPGLSRAAHRESQPVHVLSALYAGGSAGRACLTSLNTPPKRGDAGRECPRAGGLVAGAAGARAQGKVEYRPIAGTRPRGATEKEDQALADEMMHDEKERAEHVMLVDLGRNDVGRVSQFGSVKVDRLMFVERYSHVMHIVSAIEGRLRPELTAVDALRACFPAGTLSGAPKVRAMEIIEELEPARRGTYGGAVLYADFSGNLDSCIAIRSMLASQRQGLRPGGRGHRGRFGAGARNIRSRSTRRRP